MDKMDHSLQRKADWIVEDECGVTPLGHQGEAGSDESLARLYCWQEEEALPEESSIGLPQLMSPGQVLQQLEGQVH